jgi:hypothetical protein
MSKQLKTYIIKYTENISNDYVLQAESIEMAKAVFKQKFPNRNIRIVESLKDIVKREVEALD